MGIDLVKMWIEKFIVPRVFQHKAGFLLESFDYKRTGVVERDVLILENFVANLEKRVVENYGHKGKDILYSLGKTFCWNYWKMLKVEPVRNFREAEKYLKTFLYFITITYSSDLLRYKLENDYLVRFRLKDWIICEKNGLGYISSGLWAGTAAASIGQKRIEAIHPKCQGRGDEFGEALVGLPEELRKIYPQIEIIRCENFPDYKIDDLRYKLLNKYRPIPNKLSLEDFARSKFVSLKKGIVSVSDIRFFRMEITFLHLLENAINSDLIFQEAKKTGIKLFDALRIKEPNTFCEFLAAIGFGGFAYHKIGQEEIIKVFYYPYSCCLKNREFPFLCGLISGWFTAFRGREVEFKVEKYEERDSSLVIKARY